jgi:hypothetical protein
LPKLHGRGTGPGITLTAAKGGIHDESAEDSDHLPRGLGLLYAGDPRADAGGRHRAAGSLFDLAKSRLKPEDFSQVAKAVPGMDGLLKAAPPMGGGNPLSNVAGTSGVAGMAGLARSSSDETA